MKNITIFELENIKIIDNELERIISILLLSINDWPDQIHTLDEFLISVKNYILSELTEQNIEQKLKIINYNKDSWRAESMSALLDIFSFYKKEISLEEIIIDIKKRLINGSNYKP